MRYILYLLIVVSTSSCLFQKNTIHNYLETIQDTTFRKNVYIAEPLIQKNDLLSIKVYSASLDPNIDLLYNMPEGANTESSQLGGYLVDVRGNIEIPRIGLIKAEGLKKGELEEVIKAKLSNELTRPGVIVRFMNFRITVLGEVGAPGHLTIPTERLTILEAIGMAGGITEYGTIKQIKVLRENDGIREVGYLDLTSPQIFESPYYQLQQNDVILVDQNMYKFRETEQQRLTTQVGFFLSILTSLVLLYNLFK